MVVDDEEVVRSTARAALETLGFGVITASDGHEAVEVFRAMSGSISLVLLDMTMPGISGEETLRQLRRIRSDVRVILSSGFSEMEARRRFDGYRLAGFLQKPYTVGTLRARIEMAATAL
jgi:CheY-like chemotaxis protein